MKDGAPRPCRTAGAALIGWQTLLADLSLILFMVTAAAMSGAVAPGAGHAGKASSGPPKTACNPPSGEPLALWRAGGSQSLGRWLASEQPDARQQLTITVHYRRGGGARALAAAQALVDQAGAVGAAARVMIAPASDTAGDEVLASLAYDQPPQP